MINELDTIAQQWKYVNDTIVSEVEVKGGVSHVQEIANRDFLGFNGLQDSI